MVSDLKGWSPAGATDLGTSLVPSDVEFYSLYVAPAIISPGGADKRPLVRVYWSTGPAERFIVEFEGDMTYRDGEETLVVISTLTSTRLGCANGHAHIEAVQIAPGVWCQNLI